MSIGKFITIEGCEGTGKSTQIKILEKNLKKNIKIKTTREPGGSYNAEQILKSRVGTECPIHLMWVVPNSSPPIDSLSDQRIVQGPA